MSPVHGEGAWLRGGSSSGGFQGLQLGLDDFGDWITVSPSAIIAVTFPLVASSTYDSGGFRSTGPFTFGAITVPTGSALVVPTHYAGYYRMSSTIAYTHDTGVIGGTQFGISTGPNVNNQAQPALAGGAFASASSPTRLGDTASSTPRIVLLAEGDVVWVIANNLSTTADMTIFSDSWFLCEYLGS